MKKKLQVFVSSTYTDLIDERQAAVEAILNAGHIPAGMEHFYASDDTQLKIIYKWIEDCDVLLLILGGRYGSIELASGKSYVQLEYEFALKKKIPCIGIILSDKYIQQKIKDNNYKEITEQTNQQGYLAFKEIAMTNKLVKIIDGLYEIQNNVIASLNQYVENPKTKGWVRGNQLDINLANLALPKLKDFTSQLFLEYARRQNKQEYFPEFVHAEIENIFNLFKNRTFCEQINRTITIDILDDENIRVTNATFINYLNANDDFEFKIYSQMNKHQSDTFRVKLLQIDGEDYIDKIEIKRERIKNNNFFDYEVFSSSIHPRKRKFNITYDISYECSILDFYQSYRLEHPCRNFTVQACINNANNQYKLLGSKFSTNYNTTTSKEKNLPKEKYLNNICNLYYSNWSNPGTGYALCIKKL